MKRKQKQRYKITCNSIEVRIDINWDDADVDAVFSEVEVSRMFPALHRVNGSRTPTSASVDRLHVVLFDEFKGDPYNKNLTSWQRRGISYQSGSGLMMDNSYVNFCIDIDKTPVEKLADVIRELTHVVSGFVSRYVRYYKENTELKSGIGRICV